MALRIPYKCFDILVAAESPDIPRYDKSSADNVCAAEQEFFIDDDGFRPSSRHRVTIRRGEEVHAVRVLLANGGASAVRERSAFVRSDTCYVAVGPYVCALELPTLRLLWHSRADGATCFGVYDAPDYESIISHGEMEIARLSYSGQLLWAAGGRDIFTGGFELRDRYARATDFNGTHYRIELETGKSRIIAT